jgi:hypothetical protein
MILAFADNMVLLFLQVLEFAMCIMSFQKDITLLGWSSGEAILMFTFNCEVRRTPPRIAILPSYFHWSEIIRYMAWDVPVDFFFCLSMICVSSIRCSGVTFQLT